MDLGLRDRVAIVTGASRGIGRQIALDLGAEGCHLVLCGRDDSALGDTVAALAPTGVRAITVVADMEAHESAADIAQRASDEFGRVDILVNNAGGNVPRKLLALTADDWQQGFEQNFFSAVRLALACVPGMRAQRWGRIINIASTSAREPDPYFGPYAAAKAALVNFSKNLSMAFAPDGVLANAVLPGVTMTDAIAANAGAAAERMGVSSAEVMERMMAAKPVDIGRFGEASEISAAVVFLASERASWITGACFVIDGGTLHAC